MTNFGNEEILQIIESVSREKDLPKEELIKSMEQAMQAAGRKKYGYEHNIRAEMSRKSGEIKLFRVFEVVEDVENPYTQVQIVDVQGNDNHVSIGDEIVELLPPVDLGRVAAQTAKQVIVQCITTAERERQYQEFKDRKGEILSGVVKRIEFGDIIVDLGGRAEAILKRDQSIRGEMFKINDRIKAYLQDVQSLPTGQQLFLSRKDNMMLAKLFELEVPEISYGIIEVKAVARDPGSKSKIAVFAADNTVDPVGALVGIRGVRVQAITNELHGEKIDVLVWDNNIAQFIINSLSPTKKISKIIFDEDKNKAEVVMPADQLKIAIGRQGQNIKLASKLTGWHIDVISDDDESVRRHDQFKALTNLYMDKLELDEILAQLLCVEGFVNIEQIAASDVDTLKTIEGFDEQLAKVLQERAIEYVNEKNEKIIEQLEALGVEQELIDAINVNPDHLLKLAEYGIKNIEDLGETTVEEIEQLIPDSGLVKEDLELLIHNAREQN